MPFRSKAQMRYLFAKHPDVAEEFAAKTEDPGGLPERAGGDEVEGAEEPARLKAARHGALRKLLAKHGPK